MKLTSRFRLFKQQTACNSRAVNNMCLCVVKQPKICTHNGSIVNKTASTYSLQKTVPVTQLTQFK